MNIFVNQKPQETTAAHVAALVEELALPAEGIAVAVNNRIVRRPEWDSTPLAEGDRLTVIRAACGG
ncbi:MAG: sulfur carrier protein ThiS [Alloprevotella sp.]